MRWFWAVALVLLAVPALASGETLTASPGRAAAGDSVRLSYATNYGPGGCMGGEVVELFLDASPLAEATMDPRTCAAARTVRVPAAGCGRHVFRAAWRTRHDPTLYGEANAAFVLVCAGSTPTPTPHAPTATVRPRPTQRVTTGPSPTRAVVAVTTPPGVPVPTVEPSPDAAPEAQGGGSHTLRWTLLAMAGAAVVTYGLRRTRGS